MLFRSKGGTRWQDAYGWVSEGLYGYECVLHWKYGKCLYIGLTGSRVANVNHGGKYKLTEIFVHKGYTMDWRGSAGCPTIRPDAWSCFQSFFEVGDHGKIVIAGRLCECKI